jgi:hypothetical protein
LIAHHLKIPNASFNGKSKVSLQHSPAPGSVDNAISASFSHRHKDQRADRQAILKNGKGSAGTTEINPPSLRMIQHRNQLEEEKRSRGLDLLTRIWQRVSRPQGQIALIWIPSMAPHPPTGAQDTGKPQQQNSLR